ncbi:diacylglycerol/lipid kinase family protein [Methyloversatilis thermotolerans]|uniref:diacylglycerol/lipid kinase family protein n=1 Tax=Methyloversatilis thermotolerans TaxID=1346290 RepID=UPI0003783F25|nr:diacylglycerol kinase family protein [Methyloversatilis thermotolerans]
MTFALSADAPLFIVLNAASGSRDAEETARIIETVLSGCGRQHRMLHVHDVRRLATVAWQAVEEARMQKGMVVVAGGDGTINAVAQAVVGTGVPFGVLAQGTFNYFARTHGLPTDTETALRALLDGQVRPVQVGRVNDHIFLVNASLGLYPTLLENREQWKRQFGRTRLVALWAGLATLLRGHRRLTLEIEHGGGLRTMHTSTLFVGNNPLQLEQIGIAEAAALEHGRLAALALRPVGRRAMLWLLARGAFGRLGDAQEIQSFSFRTLRLSVLRRRRSHGRIKVATDGEIVWMRTPLEFTVLPDALNLVVPRAVEARE